MLNFDNNENAKEYFERLQERIAKVKEQRKERFKALLMKHGMLNKMTLADFSKKVKENREAIQKETE